MDILYTMIVQFFSIGDIGYAKMTLVFYLSTFFAAYIFIIYRLFTRNTFYDKSFNCSLALVSIIVAGIVMTIQSNLVVSLGALGALSIIRFRTAIKNPMDLIFMFWAISVGIIVGAGYPLVAVTESIIMTIATFVFAAIPIAKAPLLLIINATTPDVRESIVSVLKEKSRHYHIKSQTMTVGKLDMIIEIRVKDGTELLNQINKINGIVRCSLLDHDGEVTF